jgi:L-threonylcarbamoyladenylate synthase
VVPTHILRRAAQVLREGGVIAYPTEAVFGLGCDPGCDSAVRRILAIKARPGGAGFILIAADWAQLEGWIAPTPAEEARLLAPADAPITWVVTAGARAPMQVTGGRRTIAVRITRHAVAAALCTAAGMPLVSTSANRHGRRPARSALAARRWFGATIDLVVPGEVGGLAKPTEIRDARSGVVLRGG